MPPIKKYSEEDIVGVVLKIIEKEGLEAINARRIARELKCSIQPIFHNFKTMDDLMKKVYDHIYKIYCSYMDSLLGHKKTYKEIGLSYIHFAKEKPEFFKIIFMQESNLNIMEFMMYNASSDEVIESGMELTGLSREEQKEFHVSVWMYTHGIACLMATKTIEINESEISKMLTDTVRHMLIGYKIDRSKK